MSNTERIRTLNDKFRQFRQSGIFLVTHSINELGDEKVNQILERIRTFSDFSENNDPHGEHDFGSFEIDGHKVFWKIDYYDLSLDFGSPDPADPTVTKRVMTVMLAEEY